MKKLFAILAVAGFLTACSDGGTAEETKTTDSATTAPATTPADSSSIAPADSSALKADSSKAATDTTKK